MHGEHLPTDGRIECPLALLPPGPTIDSVQFSNFALFSYRVTEAAPLPLEVETDTSPLVPLDWCAGSMKRIFYSCHAGKIVVF